MIMLNHTFTQPTLLSQPSYAPDLPQNDYHFFHHFDNLQGNVSNDQTASKNSFNNKKHANGRTYM